MIHVFIGTKAQLIKMAPVMVELQKRDVYYNFIFSGQHQATVKNIREEFGLKEPDITLYTGKDITGIFQMLLWSIKILFFSIRNREKVWQGDKNGIVLNHGDTFSTLLGTVLARASGQRSAHIESGLRSFKLFHPFPEEITRILTFNFSNIFFAPGEWAISNLEKYRGIKINTVHNTLLDALKISEESVNESVVEIPDGFFAVASIHRFENIFSKARLNEIVDILIAVSKITNLLFILHKPTERKLNEFGLMAKLKQYPTIELRPRYTYFQFIKLIKHSTFVITDGGSNQEECYYLGKPCIIMRSTSERREGIGENAVISKYKIDDILSVVNNIEKYEIPSKNFEPSPSVIIADSLSKLYPN